MRFTRRWSKIVDIKGGIDYGEIRETLKETQREEVREGLTEVIQLPVKNIMSVDVDDENIYVGTMRGAPAKLLKSTDRGLTWTELLSVADATRMYDVFVDSRGYLYGVTEYPARVYRSIDGGETWSIVLETTGTFSNIAEDRSGYLYIGESITPPRIHRSVDGAIWTVVYTGVAPRNTIGHIYFDPYQETETIYASVFNGAAGDIIRSQDHGATWATILADTAGHVTSITSVRGWRLFGEDSAHVLYRTWDDSTYERVLMPLVMEGNSPWSLCSSPLGTIYMGEYYVAKGGRLWASPDAGETWTPLCDRIARIIHDIAISPDGYVYAAVVSVKDVDPAHTKSGYMIRLRDLAPYQIPVAPLTRAPFYDLEIRDTATHYSDEMFNGGVVISARRHTRLAIMVRNGLNQDVSITVQGDYDKDFPVAWNMVPTFVVPAGKKDYQTSEDALPYIRVAAVCSVAPTSGALRVVIGMEK